MAAYFERYRGDTKDRIYQVIGTDGTAQTITGWSAIMSFSTESEPTAASYVKQITATIADTTDFVFSFDGTIPIGRLFYDIQVTDAAGQKETVEKGSALFKQDIGKD